MKKIMVIFVGILLVLTACDSAVDGKQDIDPDDLMDDLKFIEDIGGEAIDESALSSYSYDVKLPAGGSYLPRLMGRQWGIPSPPGYDFKWFFLNDGTRGSVHCCGYTEVLDYCRYLLAGNILLIATVFADAADESNRNIKISTITLADDDSAFTWSGDNYPQRDPVNEYYASYMPLPLRITDKLTQNLLGVWQGDGAEFEFRSDTSLRIGSDLYGFIAVSKTEFLTIGPLIDGGKATLDKYKFGRTGNKMILRRNSDGEKYTLNLAPAVVPLAE